MILNGVALTRKESGTPWGKQRPEGLSLPKFACLSLKTSSAHGWKGTWTPSDAIFCRYFPPATLHMPLKSGLPSRVFGTGAVRLGFPSGRRGVSGGGTSTHRQRNNAIAIGVVLIGFPATVAPF